MLKCARGLAILLLAVGGTDLSAQSTVPDSAEARRQARNAVRALLDSAEIVRGTNSDERAFMWRVATLLSEFPDSVRAPRIMQSVNDAALALEQVLKSLGSAMAVVHSEPPGAQAMFRRIYDTTATDFALTSNDSQPVSPAKYSVVCAWPGKSPAKAEPKDCTSRCRVECLPPK